MKKVHELKILPEYFEAVAMGKKNFECRYNDRDFQVGDNLILLEYDNGNFTGNRLTDIEIIYILSGWEGLKDGYVVLGLYVDYFND